jgi:hypothetical protein
MPRNTRGLKRGGSPGRPPGRKNKVPHSFKVSIKQVFEKVATDDPELMEKAVLRGLKGKPRESFPFLQLAAYYIDGKPAETVKLQPPAMLPPMQIFLNPEGIEGKKT